VAEPRGTRDEQARRAAFMESLVAASTDAITVVDAAGRARYSSPTAERLFGFEQGWAQGTSAFDVVHPDDLEEVARSFAEVLAHPNDVVIRQFRISTATGSWRTVEARATNRLDDPDVQGVIITTRDVTDRAAAEVALRESEERYRRLVEHSPQAITVQQDGRFVYLNPAAVRLLGAESEAELLGRPVVDVVHPDDVAGMEPGSTASGDDGVAPTMRERRIVRRDGDVLEVELVSVPVTFGGQAATQVMARDVTDRRRAERVLAHHALHDHLTGLPNRALFLDRLAQALVRCGRSGAFVAVLHVDLDRFKLVVDELGHESGDRVLQAVAARLRNVVRPSDTVARFAGDEFVVVCDDVQGPAEATRIANRILEVLAVPVDDDEELSLGASIGVALARGDEVTAEALVRNADTAMHRAKELGRGRIELFDEAMRSRAVDRLRQERLLARAVAEGRLSLHYQPVVRLPELEISGVEALVRWDHPDRGQVLPGDFVPLAEESGLIVEVGSWVLGEGCRQAARWARSIGPARGLEVAVNLSAKQLAEPFFVKEVAGLLHDERAVSLWLEITETLLLEDPIVTASLLTELRGLGVKLAIDDFGTGYSSLAYLRRFPVDCLKIDQSFVSGLDGDGDSRPIAAAIVEMAHALGLRVVAEGVETPTQLEALVELGCDAAQGFLFAPPHPPPHLQAHHGENGGGIPTRASTHSVRTDVQHLNVLVQRSPEPHRPPTCGLRQSRILCTNAFTP
jgi:diguanylate cyclase (GGDEF)-like protein/PAS domain S-box-containing protein